MGDDVWCSVCSEPINGEPLVELTAIWTAGGESQTVCAAPCLEQLFTQWRDYVTELSTMTGGEKGQG